MKLVENNEWILVEINSSVIKLNNNIYYINDIKDQDSHLEIYKNKFNIKTLINLNDISKEELVYFFDFFYKIYKYNIDENKNILIIGSEKKALLVINSILLNYQIENYLYPDIDANTKFIGEKIKCETNQSIKKNLSLYSDKKIKGHYGF